MVSNLLFGFWCGALFDHRAVLGVGFHGGAQVCRNSPVFELGLLHRVIGHQSKIRCFQERQNLSNTDSVSTLTALSTLKRQFELWLQTTSEHSLHTHDCHHASYCIAQLVPCMLWASARVGNDAHNALSMTVVRAFGKVLWKPSGAPQFCGSRTRHQLWDRGES